METFRHVYGITLDATTETRRQNIAAQAGVKKRNLVRRIALMNWGYLTEIRGDSINSGHMVRKAEAVDMDGYLEEKTTHAIL